MVRIYKAFRDRELGEGKAKVLTKFGRESEKRPAF